MNKFFFNKQLVTFFFLYCLKVLLRNGNKTQFLLVLTNVISSLKKISKQDPFIIVLSSIKNVEPYCEIKNLKVRGSAFKVPVVINAKRQKYLAVKFLIMNAKRRQEKTLVKRLVLEFLDALVFTGKSIKESVELHKLVETNKIFAQFRS